MQRLAAVRTRRRTKKLLLWISSSLLGCIFFSFDVIVSASSSTHCDLRPYDLSVEHLLTSSDDLVTIRPDAPRSPRFSFKASSHETPAPTAVASQVRVIRCTDQTCAKIEKVVWDSGWDFGGRRNGLDVTKRDGPIEGLVPMEVLYWNARFGIAAEKMTVLDDQQVVPCPWSQQYEPFLVGPSETQWEASEWICQHDDDDRIQDDCDYYDIDGKVSAPIFRTEFEVALETPIKSARLFVAGLGHYEAWLNGVHINQGRYLDPAPSSYSKRAYYNSFDVLNALVDGPKQALGFLVGNGWWDPLPMKFWGAINLRESLAVGTPRVRCILQIEFYGNMTESLFVTSNTATRKWSVAKSGLLRNDLYLGNVVDLDRNGWLQGWSTVGYSSPLIQWMEAQSCPMSNLTTALALRPQPIPPIRSRPPHLLKAISNTKIDSDLIMDMGKNTAAAVQVEITVPNDWVCSEQQIELKFGEILFPNDTVNVYTSVAGQIKRDGCCGPCAPSLAYQRMILRTTKSANFTTQFSWSAFRYIQIGSLPPNWNITVTAIPLMTNIKWTTRFESSNTLINDIFDMCQNTHASNMMAIQSDCPHRERFGYTGDALATLPVSLALFDGAAFYEKRLYDILDSLRPNGGVTETAPFVGISSNGLGEKSGPIGWQSFFPHVQVALRKYYGNTRILRDARNDTRRWIQLVLNRRSEVERGLGDWMAVDKVPVEISGSVFVIEALRAWAVLTNSREEQEAALMRLDNELKSFVERFVSENGDVRWNGSSATQAGQGMAIWLDLVQNPSLELLVAEKLVASVENYQRHISTGMFGILPLFEALSMINRTDLAWDIVMQKDYPSYGFMLENKATTLWESWFFSNSTFSHSHPMFSGVVSWMLSHIGGINIAPHAIGADRLIIAPRIPGGSDFQYASLSLETARGLAICRWGVQDDSFYLFLQCPPNTRCLVKLPDDSPAFAVAGGTYQYNFIGGQSAEQPC